MNSVAVRAAVLILCVVAVCSGDVADDASVSDTFSSAPDVVKAQIVGNVKVFANPEATVAATIVQHLPPANADGLVMEGGAVGAVGAVDATSAAAPQADANTLEGDAFTPTAVEADVAQESLNVEENEEEGEESERESSTVTVAAAHPRPRLQQVDGSESTSTSPIHQMKQQLNSLAETSALALAAPKGGMSAEPPNAEAVAKKLDPPAPKPRKQKPKPVPKPKKKAEPRCPNGCSRRLPIMVGVAGLNERPAHTTRRVVLPGDHEKVRRIHQELRTGPKITWEQRALNKGRAHLKKATRRIDKLRKIRKAISNAPLNRKVVT
jgi:hypothetical protein